MQALTISRYTRVRTNGCVDKDMMSKEIRVTRWNEQYIRGGGGGGGRHKKKFKALDPPLKGYNTVVIFS